MYIFPISFPYDMKSGELEKGAYPTYFTKKGQKMIRNDKKWQ